MEISSHPNERPGNRDTVLHVHHSHPVGITYISGDFPQFALDVIAAADRDYFVRVTLEEILQCLVRVPPEELEKVVADYCTKPDKIPDLVRALTAGGIRTMR